MKTIYIATDHAGFELKNVLLQFIQHELGYTVVDCGAMSHNPDDDYPEFMYAAARSVAEAPHERRGIILGGSGTGEAIVANRVPGVRAAVYYGGQPEIVKLARQHNDANVLSLGARFISVGEAQDAVRMFLLTDFSADERHVRRIARIDEMQGRSQ